MMSDTVSSESFALNKNSLHFLLGKRFVGESFTNHNNVTDVRTNLNKCDAVSQIR